MEYDEEAYNAEVGRLKDYDFAEYTGYYEAESFSEGYTLLAMEADAGKVRHARLDTCLLNGRSMPFGKGCRHNLNECCCLWIKGTGGRKG